MITAAQIERALRSHRLPGLEECLPSEEFVFPNYGDYSLVRVPATLAGLLGLEMEGAMPPLPPSLWADLAPGVRHILFILVDAVGYTCFRLILETGSGLRRLTQAGRVFPLSAVFPTSTVASLPSLWTGTPPTVHGFVGPESWEHAVNKGPSLPLRGLIPPPYLRVADLLIKRRLPGNLLSPPNLALPLTKAGVQIVAFFYLPPPGNGLPRLLLRGTKRFSPNGVRGVESFIAFRDFYDFREMWANVREVLLQYRQEPLFLVVYWSGTDLLGHLYGPEGGPFRRALRCMDQTLESFLDSLPPAVREGTLLVFTSDHGMVQTPPDRAIRLSGHRALRRMLRRPPAGEPRMIGLHVRPDRTDALRAYVAERLGDRFLLLETERVLAAGLFGPDGASAPIQEQLGGLLLVARGDARLIFEKEAAPLYGQHGGLSPEEMLVPLLMARLDGEI